jgi:hypothetical protein
MTMIGAFFAAWAIGYVAGMKIGAIRRAFFAT